MSDDEMIKHIVSAWLANGGDSEGWQYLQYRIYLAITDAEASKELNKEYLR